MSFVPKVGTTQIMISNMPFYLTVNNSFFLKRQRSVIQVHGGGYKEKLKILSVSQKKKREENIFFLIDKNSFIE